MSKWTIHKAQKNAAKISDPHQQTIAQELVDLMVHYPCDDFMKTVESFYPDRSDVQQVLAFLLD